MPVIQLFPSTTLVILILTLPQYLHPAYSQSIPSGSAAASALPASSTPTAYPFYNFTYPTSPDHYQSGIEVSYKDTIDVSWVANGEQHSPVLQVQCWTRNDSSSFIYYDNPTSYTHTVTTSTTPSDPSFPLPVAPYRKYSPCQLRLEDPDQNNSTGDGDMVTGVAIFISQDTNASTAGVTWSADNPAPKVAVDAGVATTNSGCAGMNDNGAVGLMWTFMGVLATMTVLL